MVFQAIVLLFKNKSNRNPNTRNMSAPPCYCLCISSNSILFASCSCSANVIVAQTFFMYSLTASLKTSTPFFDKTFLLSRLKALYSSFLYISVNKLYKFTHKIRQIIRSARCNKILTYNNALVLINCSGIFQIISNSRIASGCFSP